MDCVEGEYQQEGELSEGVESAELEDDKVEAAKVVECAHGMNGSRGGSHVLESVIVFTHCFTHSMLSQLFAGVSKLHHSCKYAQDCNYLWGDQLLCTGRAILG